MSEGKHYEDDGDLNFVLIGNKLLIVCTKGPHAWLADVTIADEAATKLKADVVGAIRGDRLPLANVDIEQLLFPPSSS